MANHSWMARNLGFDFGSGGFNNQPSISGRNEFGYTDSGYGPGYTPAPPPPPSSGPDWFGRNEAGLKMGFDGLRSIGNLYTGIQSGNLANKQFNFAKDYANTNLVNQIKSYNTRLEDRANSRAAYLGSTAPENYARDYVDQNKLSRYT